MPPRIAGSRVQSVAEGQGGRPKGITPMSVRHPNFKSTAASIAKRQKISPDMAAERLKK